MKKSFFLFIISFVLLSIACFSNAFASNNIPQPVMEAANRSLEFVKIKIKNDPLKWGFNIGDDVNTVTLGDGYRLRYLNPDKLDNSNANSLLDITFESEHWQFIVYLNKLPKIFITIGYEDGEYKLIHMGGRAEYLDTALKNYKNLIAGKSQNSNPALVKYEGKYFLVYKDIYEELVLTALPYEKAQLTNYMSYTKLYKADEVVQWIKEKHNSRPTGIIYGM